MIALELLGVAMGGGLRYYVLKNKSKNAAVKVATT
jgi:hypothetical protein